MGQRKILIGLVAFLVIFATVELSNGATFMDLAKQTGRLEKQQGPEGQVSIMIEGQTGEQARTCISDGPTTDCSKCCDEDCATPLVCLNEVEVPPPVQNIINIPKSIST